MNRLLFDLQEADNLITRLTRERGKLDDGATARAERDTLQKARDAEKARLNTLNSQRSAKEDELRATEAKIARQQSRLMNATSAHEVTSLQRDIAALGKARGDLDEAILILMDEAETSAAQLSGLQRQLDEKTAVTADIERHFAAETARLEAELAQARAKREATAAQIDAPALEKYKTYAQHCHGVALAHVEKGACSVCGMTMPPLSLRDAKTQEWPTCDGCGRLLFVG